MRIATAITVALVLPAVTRAASVTVVRPDDTPMPSAAVMCRGHEADAALTGDDGRATVPDDCREVTCMAGASVSGHATLAAGTAVCRLAEGVLVHVRVEADTCGARCYAALQSVAENGDRVSGALTFDSGAESTDSRLGLVRPGAYKLALWGEDPFWECSRSLELSHTGEQTIVAGWRAPLELRGTVVGDDGAPAGDLPIRVRALDGAPADRDGWRCALRDEAPDTFSAADGGFVVPVDPITGCVIEAGSAWDPDGRGSLAVTPPVTAPVTLRLQRTHLSR